MPTILRLSGYRLFFYSNERSEPPHVHAERGDAVAKLWLHDASIASAHGFRRSELAALQRMVTANRTLLEDRWNEHFGRWRRRHRDGGEV